MTMRNKVLACACMVLAIGASASAQLRIEFEPESVVASRLTPGADAVLFGVGQGGSEWMDHFHHIRLRAADTDNDGTVTFQRKGALPSDARVLVVDLATGEWAAGANASPRTAAKQVDLGETSTDAVGSIVSITHAASRLDVLVVRPGVGAWGASIADGGSGDADHAFNHTVTVDLATLRSVGDGPEGPGGVRPGDILALGDAAHVWLAVTRVPAQRAR